MNENTSQWPVFDTLQSAAGAIGCPVHALKVMKRAGCPAFRGARIYAKDLVAWLITQNTTTPEGGWIDPGQAKARADTARAVKIELENKVTEGDLVPKDTIETIVAPLGQQLRSHVQDLPERLSAQCNPGDSQTAFKVLSAWRDEFFEVNHSLFMRKWGQEPTPDPDPAADPTTNPGGDHAA